MVRGHRDAAYFVTHDGEGTKIEGSQRQCCHCQYVWDYAPGSGSRRGWCLKHGGFLCARPECAREQESMLAQYALATGNVYSCIAFEEYNDFLQEQAGKTAGQLGQDFRVAPSGLIVPIG